MFSSSDCVVQDQVIGKVTRARHRQGRLFVFNIDHPFVSLLTD